MPSNIETTNHAVGRYEKLVPAGTPRLGDDTRREIHQLVRSGTLTAALPWRPAGVHPTDDTRRYLVFGQERALVLDMQKTADGRGVIVVRTVVTRPHGSGRQRLGAP